MDWGGLELQGWVLSVVGNLGCVRCGWGGSTRFVLLPMLRGNQLISSDLLMMDHVLAEGSNATGLGSSVKHEAFLGFPGFRLV